MNQSQGFLNFDFCCNLSQENKVLQLVKIRTEQKKWPEIE